MKLTPLSELGGGVGLQETNSVQHYYDGFFAQF